MRHKPPPKILPDRVVERAEPAGVALDQRLDRLEVGLDRGLGVLGVNLRECIVDGVGVGAVGVDPVPERRGLGRREDDVDLNLVSPL